LSMVHQGLRRGKLQRFGARRLWRRFGSCAECRKPEREGGQLALAYARASDTTKAASSRRTPSPAVALIALLGENVFLCAGHNTSFLRCAKIRLMPKSSRTNCCCALASFVNCPPESIRICRLDNVLS